MNTLLKDDPKIKEFKTYDVTLRKRMNDPKPGTHDDAYT